MEINFEPGEAAKLSYELIGAGSYTVTSANAHSVDYTYSGNTSGWNAPPFIMANYNALSVDSDDAGANPGGYFFIALFFIALKASSPDF